MRTIPVAIVLTLILTACGGLFNQQPNENPYLTPGSEKFFQGTEGVEMVFDQVPLTLYYYGNVPDPEANEFPVALMVHNKGSSFTRGGVYLSGYDPSLIEFTQIPIGASYPGACSLRIGDYGLNSFGGTMQCGDNFLWSGNEDNWFQQLSVSGQTWFKDTWAEDFRIDYTERGDMQDIRVSYDGTALTYDKRGHGLLLIALTSGLDFEKFHGEEFMLAGNSFTYPGGELAYFDYDGAIVNWPQGADHLEQHLLATSCYLYTTFAAPMVCIDPAPYSNTRKVCSPKVATYGSGNGAPIVITRVTQENTPRTAAFHITVENKGGGTVFNPGHLEKCSPYFQGGAKASDLNTIWIGEARINNQQLYCTPQNELKLQNGKATFTCLYNIQFSQLSSAYQTPIVIELWYGYSKTIDHPVQVKRVV